ncbi:hypothetical protein Tco_0758803 [Tanacetum coccineum]
MGDENPFRTLGDYSKPSHDGYRNTIELPPEDPNQHLKDFLKLVDSLNLDGENRERTRLLLFQYSLHDQARNWLERLPTRSITTWEDLTTHLEQAFIEYASSRIDEAGEGLVSNFMASQDARLTKFEAYFKQQQSEMTNKIDTLLKAITDQIAGALPSDTVKNPKLSTSPVLSAHSYPTEEPLCSTHIHGSINTITIHPKQQNDSRDSIAEEEMQEREGDPKDTNTIAYIKERRDTPLLEQKDITAVSNLGSNKDDKGIEWLDVDKPLDLVNTSEESVYKSLIKDMPKCSLNYDFRI